LGPKSTGIVAVYSRFTAARFANVRIDTTRVAIPPRNIPESETPSGIVPRWRVSPVMSEGRIAAKTTLAPDDLRAIRWTELPATERGIVNLGVAGPRSADTNTVLA